MTDFSIRRATEADLNTLPMIEDKADRLYDTLPGFEAMAEMPNLSPDGYRALPETTKIWLAENSQPLGFIYSFDMDDDAYIGQLSVIPEAARRGIGRALIATAAKSAKAAGKRGLVLTTYRDVLWNGPFYEKLGFAELQTPQMGAELLAHAAVDAAQWARFSPRVVMGRFF